MGRGVVPGVIAFEVWVVPATDMANTTVSSDAALGGFTSIGVDRGGVGLDRHAGQ